MNAVILRLGGVGLALAGLALAGGHGYFPKPAAEHLSLKDDLANGSMGTEGTAGLPETGGAKSPQASMEAASGLSQSLANPEPVSKVQADRSPPSSVLEASGKTGDPGNRPAASPFHGVAQPGGLGLAASGGIDYVVPRRKDLSGVAAKTAATDLPLVLYQTPPELNLTPAQESRLDKLASDFIEKTGAANPQQDPEDPDYAARWQDEKKRADEQLRALMGWEAYNRMYDSLYHQSLR